MNPYRRTASAAIALGALLPMLGCDRARAIAAGMTDKATAFSAVRTGITDGFTRERVVELLGEPLKSEATSLAGVETESLSWIDGSNRYTVLLVSNKAVAKRSTALKSPQPNQESSK